MIIARYLLIDISFAISPSRLPAQFLMSFRGLIDQKIAWLNEGRKQKKSSSSERKRCPKYQFCLDHIGSFIHNVFVFCDLAFLTFSFPFFNWKNPNLFCELFFFWSADKGFLIDKKKCIPERCGPCRKGARLWPRFDSPMPVTLDGAHDVVLRSLSFLFRFIPHFPHRVASDVGEMPLLALPQWFGGGTIWRRKVPAFSTPPPTSFFFVLLLAIFFCSCPIHLKKKAPTEHYIQAKTASLELPRLPPHLAS